MTAVRVILSATLVMPMHMHDVKLLITFFTDVIVAFTRIVFYRDIFVVKVKGQSKIGREVLPLDGVALC